MPLKTTPKTAARSPNTVVLYLRVTTDQADNDLSIPAQRRALEAHCRDRSYTVRFMRNAYKGAASQEQPEERGQDLCRRRRARPRKLFRRRSVGTCTSSPPNDGTDVR